MFLGQFLTERSFSAVLAATGVMLWVAWWAFTLALCGRDDR
jgi:hypothetical protein